MSTLDDVSAVTLHACLASLGQPIDFRDTTGALTDPVDADRPQLLGALAAAAERLAAHHRVIDTDLGRRSFAGGYLEMLNAGTPCGLRMAVSMVALRLRHTADVLEGYDGHLGPVIRAALDATIRFTTLAARMHLDRIPNIVAYAELHDQAEASMDAAKVLMGALMAPGRRLAEGELP